MTFDEYQKQAISTDLFADKHPAVDSHAFLAKLLGLVGEAGEVAEKFKKILRDKGGTFTKEDKKEITKELGDILWYINALSCYMDVKLEDVAHANLDKVLSRKARGVTKGSGDNR
jgi:NTP pyrophosphatase (non-canonical NTP hydrolase)